MNTANENGVFVSFERIVIASDRKLKVEILLAEENGSWYIGYEYKFGSIEVGSYYGGAYPSKSKYRKPFPSRDSAINHQLKEWASEPKEVAEAAKGFRQMTLF